MYTLIKYVVQFWSQNYTKQKRRTPKEYLIKHMESEEHGGNTGCNTERIKKTAETFKRKI